MGSSMEEYDIVDRFKNEQTCALSYFQVHHEIMIKQFVSKGCLYQMTLIENRIRDLLQLDNLSIRIFDHKKIIMKELLLQMHLYSAMACHVLGPEKTPEEEDTNTTNRELIAKIQSEGLALFKNKNSDYGNSFASHGVIGVIIRMGDKISRIKSLEKKQRTEIIDESIRDTCIDLHNYAIMGSMLM